MLVHAERWNEVCRDHLKTTSDMIVRSARLKGYSLSRLAVLVDHIHLTLGVPHEIAPGNAALSYMNNIVFAHGMTRLSSSSYYVGTFGEYDMNAIRS